MQHIKRRPMRMWWQHHSISHPSAPLCSDCDVTKGRDTCPSSVTTTQQARCEFCWQHLHLSKRKVQQSICFPAEGCKQRAKHTVFWRSVEDFHVFVDNSWSKADTVRKNTNQDSKKKKVKPTLKRAGEDLLHGI